MCHNHSGGSSGSEVMWVWVMDAICLCHGDKWIAICRYALVMIEHYFTQRPPQVSGWLRYCGTVCLTITIIITISIKKTFIHLLNHFILERITGMLEPMLTMFRAKAEYTLGVSPILGRADIQRRTTVTLTFIPMGNLDLPINLLSAWGRHTHTN